MDDNECRFAVSYLLYKHSHCSLNTNERVLFFSLVAHLPVAHSGFLLDQFFSRCVTRHENELPANEAASLRDRYLNFNASINVLHQPELVNTLASVNEISNEQNHQITVSETIQTFRRILALRQGD